jgi:lipopolysaccharide transport system permease protein
METYEIIIEPRKKSSKYWKDIWEYRELFLFLSWRDILVRYKQTVIGIAWSVIRPLLTMVVFNIIFGKLAKLPSEGMPYPIMIYSAMLPWLFFSNSLGEASNSLISNTNLLTKVYFPRIIIPASSVIVSLIDFLISFVIFIGLLGYYRFMPSWRIVTLPLFLLIAFFLSLGAGLWFASLNVKFRDFRYVVPFVVQFGLYVSPVGFSSTIVPEPWRLLYSLNPMVGVIEGFRWAIMVKPIPLDVTAIMISLLITLLVFLSGLQYFRKLERTFADVI